MGTRLARKRRGGEGRGAGREQKLEGHVRLPGVPSNIVCESPSVEFRLIKCSTLFVAFVVLLQAILSFEPFFFKSVLFAAAGSRKLRGHSLASSPPFLLHPPLHQSRCVFHFQIFHVFFFWQRFLRDKIHSLSYFSFPLQDFNIFLLG